MWLTVTVTYIHVAKRIIKQFYKHCTVPQTSVCVKAIEFVEALYMKLVSPDRNEVMHCMVMNDIILLLTPRFVKGYSRWDIR